jgi:hypothetical protein
MAHPDPIENFPEIFPRGTITVEGEPHTFVVQNYEDGTSHTKYVYGIDKAPVDRVETVTGTVRGSPYVFDKGVDYQVVDDDGDGEPDAIDWDVGGEQPDDNTEFEVTYVAESVISRYTDAHDDVLNETDVKVDEVIKSSQINNASGDDLDRIGEIFGDLGRRRGRTDTEYRVFLKSIVQSFKGRGTVPGIRFAVASGLALDADDIDIDEDFVNVEYQIILSEWTSHSGSVIEDLADLADPSGVELSGITYQIDEERVEFDDTVSITADVTFTDGVGANDTVSVDGSSVLTSDTMAVDDTVALNDSVVPTTDTVGMRDTVVLADARPVEWGTNWSDLYWSENS